MARVIARSRPAPRMLTLAGLSGQDSYVLQLTALNAEGASPPITTAEFQVPGTAGIPQNIDATSDSIAWTAPVSADAEILGYDLEFQDDETPEAEWDRLGVAADVLEAAVPPGTDRVAIRTATSGLPSQFVTVVAPVENASARTRWPRG